MRLIRAFQSALKIVNRSRRAYIVLNLVYYGLIICAMIYVSSNRSLQHLLRETARTEFAQGSLAPIGDAYLRGHSLRAVALTFGVNLIVGSFVCITLPSLAVPFSGLLTGVCRAVLWGLIFSPPAVTLSWRGMIVGSLIALLILLEGQGYVLAMFGAYVQGKTFLFPQTVGATSRRQDYRRGLTDCMRLYLLVVLVLAIAAVYEVAIVALLIAKYR